MIRTLLCASLWCVLSPLVLGWESAGSAVTEWHQRAPRDEVQPLFLQEHLAQPGAAPLLTIQARAGIENLGWWERAFPVSQLAAVQLRVLRKTEGIAEPRLATPVLLRWIDAHGKSIRASVPPELQGEPGYIPLAEPEHPPDGQENAEGWTEITQIVEVPPTAAYAVMELHLQWVRSGQVHWREPELLPADRPQPRPVRLGTVHYSPRGQTPLQVSEEFAPLLAEAARQRADLVVLGETLTYVSAGQKPHLNAEPIPGPTTELFAALAAQHRLHLVYSQYEREGNAVYNTAVLHGPDGQLLGKYRKVCLPHQEIAAGVSRGTEFPVFETAIGKIGLMVCYDGFFPEVARELRKSGAEVIAWPVWGCNPLLARARACENHVYLVSSTYSDPAASWTQSAIYDHAGEMLAQATATERVVVYEVDLSRRHFWRNNLGDFRSMIDRHRP